MKQSEDNKLILYQDDNGITNVSEHFHCVRKTVEMPVGEQFGSRGFPDVRKTPNIGIIELEKEAIKKLKEKNKEIMTDE